MVKGWLVGDRTGKESHLNVCLQAHKDRACMPGSMMMQEVAQAFGKAVNEQKGYLGEIAW